MKTADGSGPRDATAVEATRSRSRGARADAASLDGMDDGAVIGARPTTRPIGLSADEEARLVGLLEKKAKAVVPTVPKASRSAPPLSDLAGWLKVVEDETWDGLLNEDVLEAYDHFRAVVARHGGKKGRPDEYELAFALRRRLAGAALFHVNRYIPFAEGPRKSEYESARKTALEHMRGAIDEPTWERGVALRDHFRSTARFVSKAALEHEFGRKGNKWRDPERRRSLDLDPSPADDLEDGFEDDVGGAGRDRGAFFDRMGLRRTLDAQFALTAALAALPTIDHELIALWTYLGYKPSELAPLFDCSEATIAARLHVLAMSPHLAPFRK